MNKIAQLFIFAGITVSVIACGPKAPSEADMEQKRQDSIAAAAKLVDTTATAVVDTAKAKATEVAGAVKDAAKDAAGAVKDAAKGAAGTVKDAAKGAAEGAKKAAGH